MVWFKSDKQAAQLARPRVFVAPDKFLEGIAGPPEGDCPDPMKASDWLTAWESPFGTDAHCVCYQVVLDNSPDKVSKRAANGLPKTGQVGFPRLRKDAALSLAAYGVKVELGFMCFDFDLLGHAEWRDPDHVYRTLDRFMALEDDWPIMQKWGVIYTTLHGFRVVFALSEPVTPLAWQEHYNWMLDQFNLRGWEMDASCAQWNRFFRLPNVKRNGTQTSSQDYYEVLTNLDNTLSPHAIGRRVSSKQMTEKAREKLASHQGTDQPGNFKVLGLLGEGSAARPLWYRECKKILRSREPYDALFGGKPLAESGGRNTALMRQVALTCSAVSHLNSELPEDQILDEAKIYSLFYDCVSRLEEDEPTPWLDTLWRFVNMIWPKEEAKRMAFVEERQEQDRSREDRMLSLLGRVRMWWNDPELHGDDHDSVEVLKERLLVINGKSLHIMTPTGYYDSKATARDGLIPRIKKLGMADLFPISYVTGKGEPKYKSPVDLINTHAYSVSGSRGRPQTGGGTVEKDCFVEEIYARDPELQARFDPQVDGWLRAMFGAHWPKVEQWLAYSLAFEDGPICALSIKADPDVGKGMLVQGLVECCGTGVRASIKDMFESHNETFRNSPWLVVDEGWPRSSQGKAAADSFREIVGGSPITINPKYLSPVVINNPMRVIFSANNVDVVKELTRGKDLSREDRAALSQRIMHVELDNSGSLWLRNQRKDGRSRDFTSGWVEGGSGEVNHKRVARHLMWLYENRRDPKAKGGRLLIEGDAGGELMRHMRVDSGIAPLIVESILGLAKSKCGLLHERASTPMVVEAVMVGSSADARVVPVVWVTASMVMGFFRQNLARESKTVVRTQQVHSVLKSLSALNPVTTHRAGWPGTSTWYRLSAYELVEVAQRDGLSYERLEKLMVSAMDTTKGAGTNLNPSTGIRIKE